MARRFFNFLAFASLVAMLAAVVLWLPIPRKYSRGELHQILWVARYRWVAFWSDGVVGFVWTGPWPEDDASDPILTASTPPQPINRVSGVQIERSVYVYTTVKAQFWLTRTTFAVWVGYCVAGFSVLPAVWLGRWVRRRRAAAIRGLVVVGPSPVPSSR